MSLLASWASSWTALRGDAGQEWYRRSDLLAAAAATGTPLTKDQVYAAIRHLPPARRRYGHFVYTREHLIAVVECATRSRDNAEV